MVRVALVLALVALAAPARGDPPEIRVKARTVIELLGLYPENDGVIVVGRLKDKELGTGVPRRRVTLRIKSLMDGRSVVVRPGPITDAAGRFQTFVRLVADTYQINAAFLSDGHYAAAQPLQQVLDVDKHTPAIALTLPPRVDVSRPDVELRVSARVGTRPAQLPVTVRIGDARGELLGVVTTDAGGEARLKVQTARLGRPGEVTVVGRFRGDEQHNPARADTSLVVTTTPSLSLGTSDAVLGADEEFEVSGAVRDQLGPVGGAAVSLRAMGQAVASAIADRQGRFRFRLSADDYPPGQLDLRADFTPSVLWRRPATSEVLALSIEPPRPIPVHLYVVPVVVTAAVMAALVLVRFWSALASLVRRRVRVRRGDEVAHLDEDPEAPVQSGARFSRRGLRSLVTRQASDVYGFVWDPVDRVPVGGAVVAVARDGTPALETVSTASGRFALPELSPGEYRVHVGCAGYVGEVFTIVVPHRGNLHGIRVDLVQVRVRLMEVYRRVALERLPSKELWARWTPRELTRHVGSRAGRRSAPLNRLSALLERAYWSAESSDESLVGQALAIERELAHDRPPREAPSGASGPT